MHRIQSVKIMRFLKSNKPTVRVGNKEPGASV